MKNLRINELSIVEIRESTFELEDMLRKLSAVNANRTNANNDITEALLCLGNEIKQLRDDIDKINSFLVLD